MAGMPVNVGKRNAGKKHLESWRGGVAKCAVLKNLDLKSMFTTDHKFVLCVTKTV